MFLDGFQPVNLLYSAQNWQATKLTINGFSLSERLRPAAALRASPTSCIRFREMPRVTVFFHAVTIPFGGEISLPLSREARQNASFELEGKPKGVFLESFYRKGLNSMGVHAFIDDDRWLFQGMGVVNVADVYITGGIGVDEVNNTNHTRLSLEGEYISDMSNSIRSAVGFRVEQVTDAGRDPAYIPYLLLTGPNTSYTFRLTARYRAQKDNNIFTVDLGTLF